MFARNIMTKNVVTVSPETPVPEIASLLVKRGISAVPVVTESGKMVINNPVPRAAVAVRNDRRETPC